MKPRAHGLKYSVLWLIQAHPTSSIIAASSLPTKQIVLFVSDLLQVVNLDRQLNKRETFPRPS